MEKTSLRHQTPDPKTAMAALEKYAREIFERKFLTPYPKAKTTKSGPRVYHKHHILPKSLFPQFEKKKWNIVRLSLDEHFNAHVLLAKMMHEQISMHRALYVMSKRYPIDDPKFDWTQAARSEQITNAASSVQQSDLRRQNWQDPDYAQRMSKLRSQTNRQNWQDKEYRRTQAAAIRTGREVKFYGDPEAVARATAAQSDKTSAERHWRFQPVNIYRHETGELVAENVCLTDFSKKNGLNQPHMQASISADRGRPSGRGNRAHSKGYFARALDENGQVIGDACPAAPQPDHHHACRADIFRAIDDVCVAHNVIIRQFCQHNDLGIKFSQSALSRTAHADRSKPSSCENPCAHKGHYARGIVTALNTLDLRLKVREG